MELQHGPQTAHKQMMTVLSRIYVDIQVFKHKVLRHSSSKLFLISCLFLGRCIPLCKQGQEELSLVKQVTWYLQRSVVRLFRAALRSNRRSLLLHTVHKRWTYGCSLVSSRRRLLWSEWENEHPAQLIWAQQTLFWCVYGSGLTEENRKFILEILVPSVTKRKYGSTEVGAEIHRLASRLLSESWDGKIRQLNSS